MKRGVRTTVGACGAALLLVAGLATPAQAGVGAAGAPTASKGCTSSGTMPKFARTVNIGDVDHDGKADTAFYSVVPGTTDAQGHYDYGIHTAAGGVIKVRDRMKGINVHSGWFSGTDGMGFVAVIDDTETATLYAFRGCRLIQPQHVGGGAYVMKIGRTAKGATGVACNDLNGGVLLVAVPRRLMSGNSIPSDAVGKHLSGFDDEVQLGQLGEILENDSVVMSIEQFDRDGNRINPTADPGEQRWRGVTLDRYDRGRWRRPHLRNIGATLALAQYRSDLPIIRQMIKLEPTDSPVLFGLRPIVYTKASDDRFNPELSEIDGSISRGDARPVAIDYRIDSTIDETLAQHNETYPSTEYLVNLRAVPENVLEQIRPIAEAVVANIDPADRRARVTALESYLRDPDSGYRYSLAMGVVDPSVDPAVDFLINRKEGHCEYFATALTLLIRSIEIPARMVNGFKGGDYNAVAGLTTVRQKHAHSWVEALVEPAPRDDLHAVWLTLDPTPADQRNESVARVGGMIGNFRQLTDLIRYIWVFYIVGFNADRQDRFLYGPLRWLLLEAKRGFGIIGELFLNLVRFPSVNSFFSVRGFLVSFVALLLLAGLVRVMVSLLRFLWRKTRGPAADSSPQGVGNQFYRRLLAVLEGVGISRPGAETPREFARRAAQHLAGRGGGADAVADVPPLVVDAFYRIRFGNHPLSEADQHHLIARLDALEARLNPPAH